MTAETLEARDCRTCVFKPKGEEPDWTSDPCETCVLLHLYGSEAPWPMWMPRERTAAEQEPQS